MKHMKKILPCMVLAIVLTPSAHATWREDMDLLTAGAAASVVAMHSCLGEKFSNNANQFAATKLRRAAMNMEDQEQAFEYAQASFEIKVNALWQSSDGDCKNAGRLIDMARYLGFLVPWN